jgi:protocatechuate 3,4-dioxygenase beta subunit
MSSAKPFSRLPHRRRTLFALRAAPAAVAALGVVLTLGACSLDTSVTPPPTLTPAAMELVGGGAQVGAAGNTLARPITVRVTDPSGLPVTYAVVSFTPAASSGSVSATVVVTDTTGSAGVAWTLGTGVGTDSLAVTVPGLPTVTVTATATAGSPDTITVVSGAAQTAPAGTTLGTPLVVRVADHYGNAVSNANVSWVNDANGTFTSANAVTDANGRAQAVFTLGANPGLQHVTVTVSTAGGAMLTTITETGT